MHKGGSTIAATLLLVMLSGCGQSPEGAAPDETLRGSALAAADGGEAPAPRGASDAAARLPGDFPDNVFLPEEYQVDSILDNGEFTMVAVRARGDVGTLAETARASMESAGWTQQMVAGDDRSRIYGFRQEQQVASLSFDRHGDGGVLYTVQLSTAPD